MTKARELRERRAQLVADAQALIPKNGQKITPEARQKFDRLMDDADELKDAIDSLERGDRIERADVDLRRTSRPQESAIGAPIEQTEAREYRAAFDEYLRHGLLPGSHDRGMSDKNRELLNGRRRQAESRDMGVGTGNLGGFFVPEGFVYDIEQALKYAGGMLEASRIMDTATGQPLPYPTDNDTSVAGEWVGEGQQVSDQDVSIGHITFGAYKASTRMVKCSLELLQDSAFDMQNYLVQKFAWRLQRVLNPSFTNGVGTTEPMGILTAATAGPTAVGSSANTGGTETGGTSIGYIDLVALEHSVDVLYRRGAMWMMHDTTLRQIKELLDKYGRPLWTPGVSASAPDSILGYPYVINNDLPTIAPSAKTLLFGRLDKYLIRRVKELTVLRLVERYADYGQVGFIGFSRWDGNLLDAGTHPVQYLVQAAS